MTFKPMLACSTIPNLQDLTLPILSLPKFDGIRCLIRDGVAVSRNLKPIPNKHVQATLSRIPNLSGMDGELVLKSGDFNNVQSAIMSESGTPDFEYIVFDNFFSEDARFTNRLSYAHQIVQRTDHRCVKAAHAIKCDTVAEVEEAHAKWLELGYEGSILRDPDGPYKRGRSTLNQGWMLKLKNFNDAEAKIIGFEELMHNDNDPIRDALGNQVRSAHNAGQVAGGVLGALVCEYKDQSFKIGTGFDWSTREHIWKNQEKYHGKFVTFKFQELSKYGKPRFPVFKGIRHTGDMS